MFSALSCIALWHALLSELFPAHFKLTQVCQREGDRTQLFDRAIEKSSVPFPFCATAQTPSSSRSSQIRARKTLHNSFWVTRCPTRLCNTLRIMLDVKLYLRKCITQVVSGQSGSAARRARSTKMPPWTCDHCRVVFPEGSTMRPWTFDHVMTAHPTHAHLTSGTSRATAAWFHVRRCTVSRSTTTRFYVRPSRGHRTRAPDQG